MTYKKIEDLRYGTNPHQPAAFYKPLHANTCIGDLKVLKTGKSGLSQTNLEDISYALNIVKFFYKSKDVYVPGNYKIDMSMCTMLDSQDAPAGPQMVATPPMMPTRSFPKQEESKLYH